MPTYVRTEVEPLQVIIVGVQVVPDDGFAVYHLRQFPDFFDGNLFGDDLTAGPQHPDGGVQDGADGFQVRRLLYCRYGSG